MNKDAVALQQLIKERQEDRLDELRVGLTHVGQLASAIGAELSEQKVVLDEVEAGVRWGGVGGSLGEVMTSARQVDQTQGTMNKAIRKVDKLLEGTGEKGPFCIAVVLGLVLVGLLVWLFYGL
mgnify:CR=1 FL=1